MAKYQFKKKSSDPSDEQIRSKMDFVKVLQQHQDIQQYTKATQPLYKKPFFLGFMVLVGVICLILIFDGEPSTEVKPPATPVDSTQTDSLKK